MRKWEKPELKNLGLIKTYDDENTCYCDAGEVQAINDETLRKGQGGHHHRPGNPCPNKPHHKPNCGCHHCKPSFS